MRIISVGEILWDVFGPDEHLGGAPLNVAANVVRLGHDAVLLTAIGADERGSKALSAMQSLNLTTEYVQVSQRYPTGTASVFKDPDGNASFTIPRPAAFDDVKLDESMLRRLETVPADWIYFGTLSQAPEQSEQSLAKLIERLPRAKRFYDVNLRKGHWTVRLVQALSRLCTVIKVNEDEAQLLYRLTAGEETFTLKRFSRYWSALHGVETIVITLGGHGCAIYSAGTLTRHVGFAVHVVDTVGAGDAFSSGYMHGMAQGWTLDQIARFANALGATVASRSGATPLWTPTECLQLIATTSL